MPHQPSAQPPQEPAAPQVSAPASAAGGLGAIASTLEHTLAELGPLKGARLLTAMNQKGGFDCPGCAWPEPDDRPMAEFCENGAKAIAEEATNSRVSADFFRAWSVRQLAERSDHWLGKQGRLTEPMVLRAGAEHYEPIGWEEAFRLIADELRALASPDEAVFYASGRTSNEAAFLYQLFVRMLGTNNLPDCAHMCHESSGVALGETIGIGKGTVTLDDFNRADAIFVVGQNPGTNHPRMLTALQQAARNGCRIVAVNPLPEPALQRFKHPQEVVGLFGHGSPIASLFLQVRIDGDAALFKGIMKAMWEEEQRRPGTVFDHDFIRTHTTGYEALVADLDAADWAELTEASGLSEPAIREAAAIAMSSERIICTWAMGLTQHRAAVSTIREVVNFLLLRGNLGKPGAGACPVRGHSNVQGDRTMGITEKPKPAFLDALAAEFGFAPPREPGLNVVSAIKAMHEGRAKVFFALGGNFLSATPDTELTAEALRRTRLSVQVSTKLNRSHLVTGRQALILPCLGRSDRDVQETGEQFVTTENSMGVVAMSRGQLPPAGPQLKSEVAVVTGLARAVLGGAMWAELAADYDRIRERIGRVVPGFADYNRRVREPGGFVLPNGPRDGRTFATPDGRAHFTVNAVPRHDLAPGELLMMTIRSHDQFNTTIYGLDDRYRGIKGGRRVVFLNRADMAERGLSEGQPLDLINRFGGVERVAVRFYAVPFDIPRGCAATYFPEANVLVPVDDVAERSHTPVSKSVVITLRPC